MMPSMARFVMRRRRHAAGRATFAPVGLPLQSSTVTDRTVLPIDRLPQGNHCPIARIRPRVVPLRLRRIASRDQRRRERQTDDEFRPVHVGRSYLKWKTTRVNPGSPSPLISNCTTSGLKAAEAKKLPYPGVLAMVIESSGFSSTTPAEFFR